MRGPLDRTSLPALRRQITALEVLVLPGTRFVVDVSRASEIAPEVLTELEAFAVGFAMLGSEMRVVDAA